jgi:hypothetical protein
MKIKCQTFTNILNETVEKRTSFEHSHSTIDALSLRTLNEFNQEKQWFLADLTNFTDLPLLLKVENASYFR